MFLSNSTIQEYIQKGKISITGDYEIESSGISINLGNKLLLPLPNQVVDSKNPTELKYQELDLTLSPCIIKPNGFVLGSTQQSVKTDKDVITFLDGRSTYARAGLVIHLSAMVLDGLPFNTENSVLEIKNLGYSDIVLHAGERIGTYIFAQLSSPIQGEKESKYTNQNGVTPPIF